MRPVCWNSLSRLWCSFHRCSECLCAGRPKAPMDVCDWERGGEAHLAVCPEECHQCYHTGALGPRAWPVEGALPLGSLDEMFHSVNDSYSWGPCFSLMSIQANILDDLCGEYHSVTWGFLFLCVRITFWSFQGQHQRFTSTRNLRRTQGINQWNPHPKYGI